MRLGIFGGSFDPVHYGHLLLAETCREQRGLDFVWFVPAAIPPHKREAARTAATFRVEMLNLALGGHPGMGVSTLEIERGGVSYTVDTLAAMREEQPDAELFLLMGADSLIDLPTWRDPAQICQLSIPLVVRRTGSPDPEFGALASFVTPDRLQVLKDNQVVMPVVELSSRDLRARCAAGQSIRFRTPRAVEEYIAAQGLYRK